MSTNNSDKREQFGNRILTDNKNVFQHNAWFNFNYNLIYVNMF